MKEIGEIWNFVIKQPGAVIAIFTIALVIATIVYTVVTCRLLRHSRNAFLADMVVRIIISQYRRAEQAAHQKDGVKRWGYIGKGFQMSIERAFGNIDKKLGKGVKELCEVAFKEGIRVAEEEIEKEARGEETEKVVKGK